MKYIVLNYEQYSKEYFQKRYNQKAHICMYNCEFCNKAMSSFETLWLFDENTIKNLPTLTNLPKKPYNVYMRLCSEACINLWILS